MAVTFQSGSIATEFMTATVSNNTLTGAGGFSVEVANLLAEGWKVQGMFSDTTNYVAYLTKKTWA